MVEVVITGAKSKIATEYMHLLGKEIIHKIHTDNMKFYLHSEYYLFCHGLLYSKPVYEQSTKEKRHSWICNYYSIRDSVNEIIKVNDNARICIIGSESAYKGSYDYTYALTKSDLHKFVENKKLRTPYQQLVVVSPSIIVDAGMTTRRLDKENLKRRKENHPMKRFLYAEEVARMIYTLLYDQPYINNTVIRMHGGE